MIHPLLAAKHLCRQSGWRVSNLALQKILYMADMNYVGLTGQRLIDESFEAWDYGPVLPTVYHRCKPFGAKPIPDIFWGIGNIDGTPEAKMLDEAWEHLGDMSPGQLVENTHWEGGAWARHYVPGARGVQIPTADMIEEYGRRVGA